MSQQHSSVSLRGRICSDSWTCCHNEIEVQIKRVISPTHNVLTPGQPAPALTLYCKVPSKVSTGVPIFY